MDFFEDLFDFDGKKKRFGHCDDHDDDHHHDSYENQAMNTWQGPPPYFSPQPTASPGTVIGQASCRQCSSPLVEGSKFCHRCGKSVQMERVCLSCGSRLPETAAFCTQCGYKVG